MRREIWHGDLGARIYLLGSNNFTCYSNRDILAISLLGQGGQLSVPSIPIRVPKLAVMIAKMVPDSQGVNQILAPHRPRALVPRRSQRCRTVWRKISARSNQARRFS